MVLKIPPPPPIARLDPTLNRWFLELTAILNSSGLIDPNNVTGLPETTAQVVTNTTDISTVSAAITAEVTRAEAAEATLQGEITILQGQVVVLQGQVAALQVRGELLFGTGVPAAGLGKVNDWYGDTAGAVGARIFIKKAVGVWTPFPF